MSRINNICAQKEHSSLLFIWASIRLEKNHSNEVTLVQTVRKIPIADRFPTPVFLGFLVFSCGESAQTFQNKTGIPIGNKCYKIKQTFFA